MQNRSKCPLPAIYTDAAFGWNIDGGMWEPCRLEVYDVTYLHFHNTLELGICVSGQGVCYVEDRETAFGPGDVQIIFPFQPHLSKSTGGQSSRWHWLNLDPVRALSAGGYGDVEQVGRWLRREMGLCGILHPGQYPLVAQLVRQIIDTNCRPASQRVHRDEYLCASLYLLILELCEASRGLPPLPLRADARFERLLPALGSIRDDLENGLRPTVSGLSELCGMSPAGFRRVFSGTIGQSPRDYIQSACLRKARQLLAAGDDSILNVGLSSGFNDISGFNRCFLAHTGMTPSQFRREYR